MQEPKPSTPPMGVSAAPDVATTLRNDSVSAPSRMPAGGAVNVNVPTLRQVFDEQYEFVWRSLRRLGIPESDVDDVVQEVFLVVHRKLDEFAGRSKITTWLFGICFRVASDHQRRAYVRRESATEDLAHHPDGEASPEQVYEGREAREKLDEVLSSLDMDKRAVFVLYEIEGLGVEEIGEMVGIPVGTVYSRLKNARMEFERSLARLKARWAYQLRRTR